MCHDSQAFSGSRSKTACKMHKLWNQTGISYTNILYKDKEQVHQLFSCSKNRYLENLTFSVNIHFPNIALHKLFDFIYLA